MNHPSLEKLSGIKAIVFDVDGVLTDGSVLITESGEHLRSMNIKDGFAIQHAVKQGLHILIISGGNSEGVRVRMNRLGVKEVHLNIEDKLSCFREICERLEITPEQVAYMGDDLPDLEVMSICQFKSCPQDAVWEIKELCDYVSPALGGKGAARDLIEMVLKMQSKWI